MPLANPNLFVVLTPASPPLTLSAGTQARIADASGAQTINVSNGASLEFQGASGANIINIQGDSTGFTISRSGSTVILNGPGGQLIEIPALPTGQTIRFGDGSATLAIVGGQIQLGTQVIPLVPATAPINTAVLNAADPSDPFFGGTPPPPSDFTVTADTSIVTEGSAVTFTVTSKAPVAVDTTFTYLIVGDTNSGTIGKADGSDFSALTGTVKILAGQSAANFTITPLVDKLVEGLEGFKVALFSGLDVVATSPVVAINDAPVDGLEFILTENPDTGLAFTGGPGNDLFIANQKTLTAGDNLDGGAGNDTLKVSTSAPVNFSGFATQNIENLLVTADGGAVTYDLSSTVGLQKVTSENSNSNIAFNKLPNLVDVELRTLTGAKDVFVDFLDSVVGGAADAVNLLINSIDAGIVQIGRTGNPNSGIETLNLKTTGANSNIAQINSNITTLNFAGDKNAVVNTALNDTIKTIDASTATGGLTVAIGAGNTNDVLFKGGAGNDQITFAPGTLNVLDTVMGGAGTDRIIGSQADLVAASTKISGFENIQVSNPLTGTVNASALFPEATAIELAGGYNAATITLKTSQQRLDIQSGPIAGALTINDGGTAALGEAFTLGIGKNGVNNAVDAIVKLGSGLLDVLNIETNGSAAAGQGHALSILTGAASLQQVNISGNEDLNLKIVGPTQIKVLDASAATGSLNLVNVAYGGTTIIGGSGNDTILGTIGDDVINAGAGNDIVQSSLGDDQITLGAGKDFVAYSSIKHSSSSIVGGSDIDTVTDFVSGVDQIDVTGLFPGKPVQFLGNVADNAAAQIAVVPFTGKLQVVFQQDKNLLWVDANDDGNLDANDLQVKLTGVTSLAAADVTGAVPPGNVITLSGPGAVVNPTTNINADKTSDNNKDDIFLTTSSTFLTNSKLDGAGGNDTLRLADDPITSGKAILVLNDGGAGATLTSIENLELFVGTSIPVQTPNFNGFTTSNLSVLGNATVILGTGIQTYNGANATDDVTTGDANQKIFGGDGNDYARIGKAAHTTGLYVDGGGQPTVPGSGDILYLPNENTNLAPATLIGLEAVDFGNWARTHTFTPDQHNGFTGLIGTTPPTRALNTSGLQTIITTTAGTITGFEGIEIYKLGDGGNNTFTFKTGNLDVTGNKGNDTFNIKDAELAALTDKTADGKTIDGGDGTDTLSITDITQAARNLQTLGVRNVEVVNTVGNLDKLTIHNEDVTVNTSGNSIVQLGKGQQVFNGGSGLDTVYTGNPNQILNGGGGDDTFVINAAAHTTFLKIDGGDHKGGDRLQFLESGTDLTPAVIQNVEFIDFQNNKAFFGGPITPEENFIVTTNATVLLEGQAATFTITFNDPVTTITVLNVTIQGATFDTATIAAVAADFPGTEPFFPTLSFVTLLPGQKTATFTVTTATDLITEGREGFILEVDDPLTLALPAKSAVVAIDDAAGPGVQISMTSAQHNGFLGNGLGTGALNTIGNQTITLTTPGLINKGFAGVETYNLSSAGPNNFTVNTGNNTINGGSQNDTFNVTWDRLISPLNINGNAGTDVANITKGAGFTSDKDLNGVFNSIELVNLNEGTGGFEIKIQDQAGVTVNAFKASKVFLGAGGQTFNGSSQNDYVTSGTGPDTINLASGGSDIVNIGRATDSSPTNPDTVSDFDFTNDFVIINSAMQGGTPVFNASLSFGATPGSNTWTTGSNKLEVQTREGTVQVNFVNPLNAPPVTTNTSTSPAIRYNLTGTDGNDTITTGAGNDTVFGGKGNDSIFSNVGNDYLVGESGDDLFDFTSATIPSNLTNQDTVLGGAGNDTVVVTGSNAPTDLDGLDSIENLIINNGGKAVNFAPTVDITANNTANTLTIVVNGTGPFTWDGTNVLGTVIFTGPGLGVGPTNILGGPGNEIFDFGANLDAADTVDADGGTDTLKVTGTVPAVAFTNVKNFEILEVYGNADVTLPADSANLTFNTINSTSGANKVDASAYTAAAPLTINTGKNDTITAGQGNDTVNTAMNFAGVVNTATGGSEEGNDLIDISGTPTGTFNIGAGDTVFLSSSSDISGAAINVVFGAKATLKVNPNSNHTMTLAQHNLFVDPVVGATSNETLTLTTGGITTGFTNIENYILSNTATDFTQGALFQNVTAGTGNDTITAFTGAVTGALNAGGGTDKLILNNGTDISGAAISGFEELDVTGNVTIKGAQHAFADANVTAGGGSDKITFADAVTGLTGYTAIESYQLANGANSFTQGTAAQNVTGGTGNDSITAFTGVVTGTLDGAGAGDTDQLILNNGTDISAANVQNFEQLDVNGNVTISGAQHAFANAKVTGAGLTDKITLTTVVTGLTGYTAIESYQLANGANSFTQGTAAQTVTGGTGDDSITAAAGVITGTLDGGAQTVADELTLQNGTDISGAVVQNFEDLVLETGGTFAMTVAQHNQFTGAITATGTETIKLVGGGTTTALPNVEQYLLLAATTFTAFTGQAVTVTGSAGNDSITGSDLVDSIVGGGGNDTITTGLGADVVELGTGNVNSTVKVDTEAGVTNTVTVTNGTATITLTGGAANTILDASASTVGLTVNGSAQADDIKTGAGADTIVGGGDNDTVTAGAGNDTVTVTGVTAATTLNGGADTDTLELELGAAVAYGVGQIVEFETIKVTLNGFAFSWTPAFADVDSPTTINVSKGTAFASVTIDTATNSITQPITANLIVDTAASLYVVKTGSGDDVVKLTFANTNAIDATTDQFQLGGGNNTLIIELNGFDTVLVDFGANAGSLTGVQTVILTGADLTAGAAGSDFNFGNINNVGLKLIDASTTTNGITIRNSSADALPNLVIKSGSGDDLIDVQFGGGVGAFGQVVDLAAGGNDTVWVSADTIAANNHVTIKGFTPGAGSNADVFDVSATPPTSATVNIAPTGFAINTTNSDDIFILPDNPGQQIVGALTQTGDGGAVELAIAGLSVGTIAAGDKAYFVLDNGTDTGIYRATFTNAGLGIADFSVDLVGILEGVTTDTLVVGNFSF